MKKSNLLYALSITSIGLCLFVLILSKSKPSSVWSELHKNYEQQEWINKPSIFAQEAITYFPQQGHLLDLGAGQGQDSRFFAQHGYSVASTDISDDALALHESKISSELQNKITVQKLDLSEPFDFPDASFDVVYAHLSLHYFDTPTTTRIFNDIYRILKPNGMLALIVNSDRDPEFGSGKKIEDNFFHVGQATKRYFSTTTIQPFIRHFKPLLLDDAGQTYKDNAKGIHGLIRFIGRKV